MLTVPILSFQGGQRGVKRRLTEPVLGPNARLFGEARLEALSLFDVDRLEVAESGIGFEAIQGLRHRVECRLAKAFGLGRGRRGTRVIRSFWG